MEERVGFNRLSRTEAGLQSAELRNDKRSRDVKSARPFCVYPFLTLTFGNTVGFLGGSVTNFRLLAFCCFFKSATMASRS